MSALVTSLKPALPVAAVLTMLALVGCSGGGGVDRSTPGTGASGSVEVTAAAALPSREVIDQAPPVAQAPKARETLDAKGTAVKRRNDRGQLWVLDDAASQACAQAEFALTAFEAKKDPAAKIAAAAKAAASSRTASVRDLAGTLAPGAQRPAVVTFLKACSAGGYEL